MKLEIIIDILKCTLKVHLEKKLKTISNLNETNNFSS